MGRYYQHLVKELPSVTTIISDCTDKPALVQWAANCAVEYLVEQGDLGEAAAQDAKYAYKKISKTALRNGSIVHKFIENYLLHRITPKIFPNDEIYNSWCAFLSFEYDTDNIISVHTEHNVFGPCWAGTLDWLVKIKDKLYVVDFKTSKAINPEMRYQTAAYRSLTEAEGNAVLRLDKLTGEYEFKDFSKTYNNDLRAFNAMVNLYFTRHPRIAKKAGVPF